MYEIETVIDAARHYGAECVQRLEGGGVQVSFREFDRQREIGFLEVRVDSGVGILDYRQSDCRAGQRWAARVSGWLAQAGEAVARPTTRSPPWVRSSAADGRGRLFN